MDIYDKIQQLMNERGVKPYAVCKATGISTGLFSQWKKRSQNPSRAKLRLVANYFGVSSDYFEDDFSDQTAKKELILTRKDEHDIAKKLQETLDNLSNADDALMFDGEPLDEQSRELLRESLENSLRIGKLLAKQKYNPNKNK